MSDKAIELDKPRWFLNSWFDILFLQGFPLVILTIPLMYYLHRNIPNLQFYDYTITNFPHVLSGLIVAYLVQKEYKINPVKFLVIPLILFIATLIFYTKYTFHFYSIRYYGGRLHLFIQCYYLLSIFKLRYNDSLKIDKAIDTLVLMVSIIPLTLYGFYEQQTRSKTVSFYGASFCEQVFRYLPVLIGLAVAVFLFRQFYLLLRKKKFYPFKISFVLMFILINYYPLGPFRDVFISRQTVIQFHNIQYIAWVWLFCQKKFREGVSREAKFISYFAQYNQAVLYFAFLFSMSIVFSYFILGRLRPGYYQATTGAFALVHFYVDWLIWKIATIQKVMNV